MIIDGKITSATQSHCEHFDHRPLTDDISLLVIHNISLPPGQFGNSYVEQFFAGQLKKEVHPFFCEIDGVRVSSHLYIKRDGQLVQFVNLNERAWHAGVSSFEGREKCNDFSIGIELEGTDDLPYTDQQYQQLAEVTKQIMIAYPKITLDRVCGHSDIAPGRKTDPGEAFDWGIFEALCS